MKQYKLCIRIEIIKRIKIIKGGGQCVRTERREGDFFFLFFISFSDLWKSDRRFLSEYKAKLVYVTRATRRNQYLSVSSNFKR